MSNYFNRLILSRYDYLQNLDNRLRSLIRTETTNSEIKGQLEFLLNLLCKGGDQMVDQSSDNEQDNDDVNYFISSQNKFSSFFLLGGSRCNGS